MSLRQYKKNHNYAVLTSNTGEHIIIPKTVELIGDRGIFHIENLKIGMDNPFHSWKGQSGILGFAYFHTKPEAEIYLKNLQSK